MTTNPTHIYGRAVRRGYDHDDATLIAEAWGRPIGQRRPRERKDALELCLAGSLAGHADAGRLILLGEIAPAGRRAREVGQ